MDIILHETGGFAGIRRQAKLSDLPTFKHIIPQLRSAVYAAVAKNESSPQPDRETYFVEIVDDQGSHGVSLSRLKLPSDIEKVIEELKQSLAIIKRK